MKPLIYYLNMRSPQELSRIAEVWDANLSERMASGGAYELAQEIQSEFLQRRVFTNLNPTQLKVLETLLKQSEFTASRLELHKQLPQLNEAQLILTLEQLQKMGVVFELRVKAETGDPEGTLIEQTAPTKGWAQLYGSRRIPQPVETARYKLVNTVPRETGRTFRRFLSEQEVSHPTRRPLHNLLDSLEPDTLEVIASAWGVLTLVGNLEAPQLATELARVMNESARQEQVLAELPKDSCKLFKTLKAADKPEQVSNLLADFVSYRRLGRTLRPLLERHLVWQAFEDNKWVIFVPAEIAKPAETAASAPLPLQTVTPPPDATPFPPYFFAWDMVTLAAYVATNPIELTANYEIPKRIEKKIFPLFWTRPDEKLESSGRFDHLLKMCRHFKLLERHIDTSTIQLGEELDEWLKLDFYTQTRRMVELWLSEGRNNTPFYYPYFYQKDDLINAANRKILGWLAECEPGTWYSFPSLLEKIRLEDPYFILPRSNVLQYFGGGRAIEFDKNWNTYNGAIIRYTFNMVLEWFGIIKVGRDETGEVSAFSLTDFGAEICGRTDATRQSIPPTSKSLLVQPNLEVMLFAPDVEAVWKLQQFATLKKLDNVSLYTLTKEALLRGLAADLKLSEVIEWLETRNQQPLPQNLLVTLQDWGRGFKRVSVENVTLLEVNDAALLDELMSSKQYASYFVRRIAPTAAIVKLPDTLTNRRVDPLKTFKNNLKKGGFFSD
jgi:hypothetical protein